MARRKKSKKNKPSGNSGNDGMMDADQALRDFKNQQSEFDKNQSALPSDFNTNIKYKKYRDSPSRLEADNPNLADVPEENDTDIGGNSPLEQKWERARIARQLAKPYNPYYKIKALKSLSAKDRFDFSKDLPNPDEKSLQTSPYSTRDLLTIFDDASTDYFRHGLQVVHEINTELPTDFESPVKRRQKDTPFENEDPVMFGFELVINNPSSPLFNGSVNIFLNNYSFINEIGVRQNVYEDFKNEFQKIFKTLTPIKIDSTKLRISNGPTIPNLENKNQLFNFGKKAYLSHYLKGVKGLDKLVESNTSGAKKYTADYNKDIITLDFAGENVSLTLGTLVHLYKLLYWSKPNGKGLIPENLLRFNCEIIISEVRNYKRVRKAITEGSVQVIKENLSRYIYSLRECQFYFDKMPHDVDVDLTAPKIHESYSMSFDYKYSSVKLEKFIPTGNGFGTYAGYDGGAIWKIGNAGTRADRTNPGSKETDSSRPRFFTIGENPFNENGLGVLRRKPNGENQFETANVKPKPFVIQSYPLPTAKMADFMEMRKPGAEEGGIKPSKLSDLKLANKSKVEKFKDKAINKVIAELSKFGREQKARFTENIKNLKEGLVASSISYAQSTLDQTVLNLRQQLLQKTLNAIAEGSGYRQRARLYEMNRNLDTRAGGKAGGNPFPKYPPKNPLYGDPRNIYLDGPGNRFINDVGGQVRNFVGDTLGGFFGANPVGL